jgi:hypothetical protein
MTSKSNSRVHGAPRRSRGFRQAAALVQPQIRKAGESRGFAVTRLLTHWPEIVGEDMAGMARPIEVGYGRKGGLGATLTVLTTGALAPMLEMQKESLRDKVNACYGYAAISRIRITQTAPTGFADGQVAFEAAPKPARAPDPETVSRARDAAKPIADDGLRQALEALGRNVMSKKQR